VVGIDIDSMEFVSKENNGKENVEPAYTPIIPVPLLQSNMIV